MRKGPAYEYHSQVSSVDEFDSKADLADNMHATAFMGYLFRNIDAPNLTAFAPPVLVEITRFPAELIFMDMAVSSA